MQATSWGQGLWLAPWALAGLVLLPALAHAAPRPKAGTLKLDERNVERDVVVVLADYAGSSKSDAMSAVSRAAQDAGFEPKSLTVGLVLTSRRLLAIQVSGSVLFRRCHALAAALSRQEGMQRTWVTFFPGAVPVPKQPRVEGEGVWTYEGGKRIDGDELAWRTDSVYLAFTRRRLPEGTLRAHKAKTWPLSRAAQELGIPGRFFFESPGGLLRLAEEGWPKDVGDDLVRLSLFLPEDLLIDLKQKAEVRGASASKLLSDAIAEAHRLHKLGVAPRKPKAGRTQREFALYLPAAQHLELIGATEAEDASVWRVVADAWWLEKGSKN